MRGWRDGLEWDLGGEYGIFNDDCEWILFFTSVQLWLLGMNAKHLTSAIFEMPGTKGGRYEKFWSGVCRVVEWSSYGVEE